MSHILNQLYLYENIISTYSLSEINDAIYSLEKPFDEHCMNNYLRLKNDSKDCMQYDAINGTYKQKNSETYETIRKKALERLEETTDILEQVELITETAKQLKEAAFFLEYNQYFGKCYEVLFRINVCRNMMLAGATLTEIVKYVPNADWADVYHLGEKYLGIKLELSEDEKKRVEEGENKENAEPVSMASLFGMADSDGLVPYYDKSDKCWVMKGENCEYRSSALDIGQKFVGFDLSYPYYNGNLNIVYKNTFEEIIEEVLRNPDKFSISGLEDSYSKSERMLIEKTQEKLHDKMEASHEEE